MGIRMKKNENCPCVRKKCERHGKCDECRKHHAEAKQQRPVYCEKKKKDGLLCACILIATLLSGCAQAESDWQTVRRKSVSL